MPNYDFTANLSPFDFELLCKDLLECDLGIRLENFREGKDKGIDLRYAPVQQNLNIVDLSDRLKRKSQVDTVVQCKRHHAYASLKSELVKREHAKIVALNPSRYILATSASLSPQQADELQAILSPFIKSTGDIYGKERLNALLTKFPEVERRHMKLWATSAGLLESFLNAGTHVVSREEIERTIAAARLFVRNPGFDKALEILKRERVCVSSGMPGIGKTTLARMLLLYFFELKFEIIKIESDVSEARSVGYRNCPRFYYYDDFLGQTAHADKLNKNEDQKLLDFMKSVNESKNSVFVLTTREYILNQARQYYEKFDREKFDHRTCIVDLSSYSRRIRAQILYNHIHFSDSPSSHREMFINQRGYLQVVDHENYNPRLIEYLVSPSWIGNVPAVKYLNLFISKLDNPSDIWNHAFRNQISSRARHLLYVLTTLPNETIIDDLKSGFEKLHFDQCRTFKLESSPTDFEAGLKELDGTFTKSRKARDKIIISFQNPSIRDFMQHILLSGEMLDGVLGSLVFFEQAKWFSDTLLDKNPQTPIDELKKRRHVVLNALKGLISARSCLFSTDGDGQWSTVTHLHPYFSSRLADIAEVVDRENDPQNSRWIDGEIQELTQKLVNGKMNAGSCSGSVERLRASGHLDDAVGREFIHAVKSQTLDEPYDVDDFEALAEVLAAAPEYFTDDEKADIRWKFEEWVERYTDDCESDDAEELREAADRLEVVCAMVGVNSEKQEEYLRDLANQLEGEEESQEDWDPDDGGSGYSDPCTDADLDSMFRTL